MATLTAKTRNALSEGSFALPGRRYPIHDLAHARNALARVAQHGTPDERSAVRKAVYAKYPGLKERSEKEASLCEAIAGTLNQSDFARFNDEYEDPAVAELLPKTPPVMEALTKLCSKPILSGAEMLERVQKIAERPRLDVVQLVPNGYGYILKYSAAPKGVEKKEKKVSKDQAKQVMPQEALDTADEQGAATLTEVEAQPDPLVEQPAPAEGFGMYKVFEEGTGRQMVGFVIPGLFDPRTGQNTPVSLFVNGGQYCIQPQIMGVLVGVSYNLPETPDPRGLGVFYKSDGRTIIATIPFVIVSRMTVEGRDYLAAQTQEGTEVQLVMSEGLRRPVATSPTEIAIPADYSFLALDNEILLSGADQDPMASTKAAAVKTMCEIRAWRNELAPGGGCHLSGPVFEKIGGGTHDWVDGLFWLAAAGMPQNLAVSCLDKAAHDGSALRMYGLAPLEPHDPGELKEAAAEAVADLHGVKLPERVCLLREAIALGHDKEARSLVGVDSIDHLLALNFLNPENVEDFVEHLPGLEETASKLASLVFATQLGLQGVPKTAAIRAMRSLDDVIQGLKALKSHKL